MIVKNLFISPTLFIYEIVPRQALQHIRRAAAVMLGNMPVEAILSQLNAPGLNRVSPLRGVFIRAETLVLGPGV